MKKITAIMCMAIFLVSMIASAIAAEDSLPVSVNVTAPNTTEPVIEPVLLTAPVSDETNETAEPTLYETNESTTPTPTENVTAPSPPPVISPAPAPGITYPTVEQYMEMRHFSKPTGNHTDEIMARYSEQAKTRCLLPYGNRTFLASVGVLVKSKIEGNKTVYYKDYICFFPGSGHHKKNSDSGSLGGSSGGSSDGTGDNGNNNGGDNGGSTEPTCHYEDKTTCTNKNVCSEPVCHKEKYCDQWERDCKHDKKKCVDWDWKKVCEPPVCHEEQTCTTEKIKVCS